MLKKTTYTLFSFFIVFLGIYFGVHFIGTVRPRVEDYTIIHKGEIFSDKYSSLRHVFVSGSPYNIGFEYGKLLEADLLKQEDLMMDKLGDFIPSRIIQRIFFFFSMFWFNDIDAYIDIDSLSEMEGVSKWAPSKYDHLATPLTRQVAYHGIHEVGQMFVDDDRADVGCFSSIIKTDQSWIIGRNFDFDIDGFFDQHKIIKWVFPDNANSYISVIFPGMVGAVTGVNEKGIYVSINAGGSNHWRRVGTPTTIVVKRVLQEASTIDEALDILKKSKVFITDIFILADIDTPKVYKIEKSPEDISIEEITNDSIVSNHLVDKLWESDETNLKRQRELTTISRFNRGRELLKSDLNYTDKTLSIIRDKKNFNGELIHFGHRGSIDPLIASHSTILDFEASIFYINEGPGTSGRYIGYDLAESFAQRKPMVKNILRASLDLSPDNYLYLRNYQIRLKKLNSLVSNKDCKVIQDEIRIIKEDGINHYDKDLLLADFSKICESDLVKAKNYWRNALNNRIPFLKKKIEVEGLLNE